ncbi:pentatricopeptide repeat-containing protein 1, mitochondrial [Salminus brasiliensis]|uniref:pentatricopeptide repeat-containing protein 1, mitochondrial n=1 Tax=Salminus brasiliensis TaxID=930266 RepID=UPI003B83626B
MWRGALLRAVGGLHGAVRVTANPACAPVPAQRGDPQRRGFWSSTASRKHRGSLTNGEPTAEQDEDSQQFGDYSSDFSSRTSFRRSSPEQQDLRYREDDASLEEKEVVKFRSKNTPYWYFLQCKKLIKQDKLAEALALFEEDMLKGERIKPEEFNYTVLIGGCGRVGYVKKAFQLYNSMKKRGLEPSGATYTSLFNACAESPWKQSGMEQALKLYRELRNKNIELGAITCYAWLKTAALCGGLRACLDALRDVLQSGLPVTQETFQYLLMSCVKDRQQGFLLALQMWHQMLGAGIKPSEHNYNVLLRIARDCGIGDPALASTLLLRGPEGAGPRVPTSRRGQRSKARDGTAHAKMLDLGVFERSLFALEADSSALDTRSDGWSPSREGTFDLSEADAPEDGLSKTWRSDSAQLAPLSSSCDLLTDPPSTSQSSCLPNLLDPSTCRSEVVALGTVKTSSDRLALMGDLDGFLSQMAKDGVTPDIKTITLLADMVKPSSQSIQRLISVADEHRLKLDVVFFNTLISKAAKTGDLDGAKAVQALMLSRNVHVNVKTFAAIALACRRQKDGLQLLSDMQASDIAPNVHVFSTLVCQAAKRLDYAYLQELLRQMHQLQVPPNEVIIRQLEFAAQYPPTYDKLKSKNTYLEKIDGFRGYYKEWLLFMPGQETPHPWDKYRLPKLKAEEPDVSSDNETSPSSSQSRR